MRLYRTTMASNLSSPVSFSELGMVEPQFYLKPLLPVFIYGGNFYLLALSQNKIRFFSGSRDGLREIFLKEILQSLGEASQSPSEEQSLQFHTRAPSIGQKRAAIFHGQGAVMMRPTNELHTFSSRLIKALTSIWEISVPPFFWTGVEYLFPIYKETNTYPQLRKAEVKGNADEKSLGELHRQVWPFVQKEFDRIIEQEKARCEELLGTAMASNDMKAVVLSAV
jgi:hypothetical protein